MSTSDKWTVPVAVGQVQNTLSNIFTVESDVNFQMWGGLYQNSSTGGNNTIATTYFITRRDGTTATRTLASYEDSVIDYGYTANVTVLRSLTTFSDNVVGQFTLEI